MKRVYQMYYSLFNIDKKNSYIYLTITLLFIFTNLFSNSIVGLNATDIKIAGQRMDITEIKIAGQPMGIAINEKTNDMYVANDDRPGYVYIIDGNDKKLKDQLPVGIYPNNVMINSNTSKLYVENKIISNDKEKTSIQGISIIDTLSNKIIKNITSFSNIKAINEKKNELYLIKEPNTIIVLDGTTFKIKKNITVGTNLGDLTINPVLDSSVYVTDEKEKMIFEVDIPSGIIKKGIEIREIPNKIEVNINTNKLYVVASVPINEAEQSEFVIPTSIMYIIDISNYKIIDTITVFGSINDLDINTKANEISLISSYSNTLSVIDGNTNKIIEEIPTGIFPISIAVNENTNTTAVVNRFSGTVTIY
jgi:YVTN family beta-propeller protein